jgi:hypothetical protein
MTKDEAILRIKKQVANIEPLNRLPRFSPEFKKWWRETKRLLERIFGGNGYQVKDFASISYVYDGRYMVGDDSPFEERYRDALKEASAILTSIHEEVAEYGLEGTEDFRPNPLSIIETICSRFHAVARQLRSRHDTRPTLEVEDEYDVQDLLHALLRVNFKDIRPEEWTPSYAGASSRMDFLLKDEQVVVEVKKTRKSLKEREVGDQLIIDIARYEAHPDCKMLVCFVYDPDGWVGNPTAIKSDLEKSSDAFQVKVFIYPETR